MDDLESATQRLRQRWQLASVLDFFHVFAPLIEGELGLSAEDIEAALVTPNNNLAKIHTALLKGIPPLAKNLKEPNAWITITSKKLAPWWKWVAEGENPLKPDHGKEVTTYNELDPITRLLILKALCELRGEQEDVLRYINDEIKAGKSVTNFRQESIGTNKNGSTYWYNGDSVIGYRIYKEEVKFEFEQNPKGKGCLTEPKINFEWETVATNFDEFNEITEKFLSSGVSEEIALGERIQKEIIPILVALEKKKERKIKKQQREAMMLEVFRNSIRGSNMRRTRKQVSYTYDDYDERIDEAIKEAEDSSQEYSPTGDLQSDKETSSTGEEHTTSDNNISEENQNAINKRKAKNKLDKSPKLNPGLRRSTRNTGTSIEIATGTPEAKKRLRQRLVINTEYNSNSQEDSENNKKIRVSDSESE